MTHSMPLFPEPTTERSQLLGPGEPARRGLAELTVDEAVIARANVNMWFSELDNDVQASFASRLTSNVDVDHYQALDELYVHHMLKRRYTDVRYEEGGIGPEYRVYDDRGTPVLAVEVLTLFDSGQIRKTLDPYERLSGEVNSKISSKTHIVQVEEQRGNKSPKVVEFAQWLENEISDLILVGPDADASRRMHRATYREQKKDLFVEIDVMIYERETAYENEEDVIALSPFYDSVTQPGRRLFQALRGKSSKDYDVHGIPFVAVVSLRENWLHRYDLELALFGRETGSTGKPLPGWFTRSDQNTRFSAAILLRSVFAYAPDDTTSLLMRNPHAATELVDPVLPVSFECLVTGDGAGDAAWSPELPPAML